MLLRASYQDSCARVEWVRNSPPPTAHREALAKVGDSSQLGELCNRMQSLVLKAGITDDVRDWVLAAYQRLGPGAVVGVRSSATGGWPRRVVRRDERDDHQRHGRRRRLIDAVQRCWASLFSPRVILEPAGALRLVPQWPSLCN